jgi:ABC-type multidrug transport system fused ATPase/permease subunit
VLIADYSVGDVILTSLSIFFFIVWLWILITILGDLFRDHELSGWAKAGWVLFLVLVPYLAGLVYLISRGAGMRERSLKEQAEVKRHMDSYIRETAGGSSTVDELARLSELKDKGSISDAEFEQAKAKLLA